MTSPTQRTGIWDNHNCGDIGTFLRCRVKPEAELSFVSAYFTIYAYAALKDELDDDELADLQERLSVGKKLAFRLEHLDVTRWLQDLKTDKKQLISIHETAAAVTPDRDAKLNELKELIAGKQKRPINAGNRKVLVFTAFSDTALYLYDSLLPWVRDELGLHVAIVTGGGENKTTFKPRGFQARTDFNAILTNFSPPLKAPREDDP